MKQSIMIVIVIVVILGGIALTKDKGLEYKAPTEVIKEVEKEVDALEVEITTAQEAKRVEIETLAKKAYDEAYDQEMKKVELEVVKAFNEKLSARQIELEKETKQY